MHQGKQSTCTAFALAQVCSGMLRLCYEVVLPETRLADMFKMVAGLCGHGANGINLINKHFVSRNWNEMLPQVEDTWNGKVYTFKMLLASVSFDEAESILHQLRGTCAVVATVEMPKQKMTMTAEETGPDETQTNKTESHDIAAFDTADSSIVGVNSWGMTSPFVYIARKSYTQGWFVLPQIVSVQANGKHQALPAWSRLFSSRISPLLQMRPSFKDAVSGKFDFSTFLESHPLWKVAGGSDSGGIVVRKGPQLDSAKEASRLSTEAVVSQGELCGERMRYTLLRGMGPHTGWVSRVSKGTELLVKVPEPAFELLKAVLIEPLVALQKIDDRKPSILRILCLVDWGSNRQLEKIRMARFRSKLEMVASKRSTACEWHFLEGPHVFEPLLWKRTLCVSQRVSCVNQHTYHVSQRRSYINQRNSNYVSLM